MSDSQEVFRLRKAGQVDEAYMLAREILSTPNADDWDIRAMGWCLVDLLKRAARQTNWSQLACFASKLEKLPVPEGDDILEQQRRFALSLAENGRHEILAARNLSKTGQHDKACRIYQDLYTRGALYPADHSGYGWDLYRWTKDILSVSDTPPPAAIGQARRNLNAYMKLTVDRPSPLHSCMLKIAWQLASGNHLKLPVFLDLWGIENFLPNDFDRFTTTEGRTLPALAEKVVQRAAKEAALSGDTRAITRLMPHLKAMMVRYPDNPWFRQSLVKFLSGLGRQDEARSQAILFARDKSQEFWAWDLLGDLQDAQVLRIACYCKGLLCPAEEEFIGRLRLKLAHELSACGYPSEARGEIEAFLAHRQQSGYRIPREVEDLTRTPWYTGTAATAPDRKFYARLATRADELLYEDLDWISACAGESFTIEGDKRKTRRRLYVADKPLPREIAVPERALGLKDLRPGQPIQIKADLGATISDRVKLYTASLRDAGSPYDVFLEVVGIVDHVNTKKDVLHVVAGRDIDGIISLLDLAAQPGDHVALRVARYSTRMGVRTKVITAAATDAEVGNEVCRRFQSSVRISNGMGFTDDGIFIPPDIVRAHNVQHDDVISGRAVINFNKKKRTWGWKALSIDEANESDVP